MLTFSKKKSKTHQAVLVVVVAFYLIVICTIDLFHNEGCVHGNTGACAAGVLSSNESCPACIFLAGYNSTEADYGSVFVGTESQVIFQSLQHFTIVNRHEWASSIVLRAPPSILTS